MRKTLEDLYYGNIMPYDQQVASGSEMRQAMDRVSKCEEQLAELLNEEGQHILTRLIRSQQEIDSRTALENFILGFRLGVRLMAECMDNNDGDIRSGVE